MPFVQGIVFYLEHNEKNFSLRSKQAFFHPDFLTSRYARSKLSPPDLHRISPAPAQGAGVAGFYRRSGISVSTLSAEIDHPALKVIQL